MAGADDRTDAAAAVLPWRSDTGAALYHGPMRSGVHAEHRIAEVAVHGPMPYHGIIPRGLVRAAPAAARGARTWDWAAPLLEEVLNRLTAARIAGAAADLATAVADARRDLCAAWPDRAGAAPSADLLRGWVVAALDAGVLSYAQSAAVARRAARDAAPPGPRPDARPDARPEPGPASELRPIELWSAKEGHTSSVWRVELGGGPARRAIAINVARDAAASAELADTSGALAELHRRCPEVVHPIASIGAVRAWTARGVAAVSVTSSAWLDGARELHVVPDGAGGGRFMVVEAFAAAGPSAGGVQEPHGRLLTASGSDAIWLEHVGHAAAFASADEAGGISSADVELNDGDYVWTPAGLRIVAISGVTRGLDRGAWLLSRLVPSARNPYGGAHRIYWNQPALALAGLARAWPAAGRRLPPLRDCLRSAATVSDRALALACGGAPIPILERARRTVRAALDEVTP